MSWQDYVDNNLIGSGRVQAGAIVGTGGGIWASKHVTLSQEEATAIFGAFDDLNVVRASGIRIGGTKYFTTTADEKVILGKKGSEGCVLARTKQATIVAVYKDPIQAQECRGAVEPLADYLIGAGY